MAGTDNRRVIIVTGASRGLGRETAIRFGKAGDRVVVNFMDHEQAAVQVADTICQHGGEAIPFRADIRSSAEVDEMINHTIKRWGGVNVLVNNAGVAKDGLLLRMTEKEWDTVLNTNLTGAFHAIRAASRIMSTRRQGHIINISSITGVRGRAGQANYAASKAGLIGLTKTCAKELGPFNIKVNAVLPGFLPTDMGDDIADTARARIVQENALNRISKPQEVAEFIYRLSLMDNVSGQVFNLDSRIL